MHKIKVLILFGGCSPEHDVSLKSAFAAISNADKEKYEIIPLGITMEGKWLRYYGNTENIQNGSWSLDINNCVPAIISPDKEVHGITEFYKKFALNFGDLVSFIKDYDSQTYDTSKLDLIINLRNSVMHHSPLLFDYNFESTVDEALKGINALVEMLPSDYKDGCITNLKVPNKKTQDNIASAYYKFLLYQED